VWLGGRAAEELAFQEISTGGQNDLQRATDVARAMVTQYGMSDALGPVALDRPRRTPFLPVPGMESMTEALAEQTAREVDVEVKRLMMDAYDQAIRVLREHRAALDAVMRRLLEREVVEGADVRSLVKSAAASGPRAA
jgi:cell division protease FtsH